MDDDTVCRVSGVYVGEYSLVGGGTEVTCTPSELRYVSPDGEQVSLPLASVDRVVADEDGSLSGFRALALVFAGFALLFSALSVPFVLRGVVFDPVGFGAYLAAGLSWYGAADCYRMGDRPLDVLEVRAGDRRVVFLARRGEADLDKLGSALAGAAPDAAGTDADSERGRRTVAGDPASR